MPHFQSSQCAQDVVRPPSLAAIELGDEHQPSIGRSVQVTGEFGDLRFVSSKVERSAIGSTATSGRSAAHGRAIGSQAPASEPAGEGGRETASERGSGAACDSRRAGDEVPSMVVSSGL